MKVIFHPEASDEAGCREHDRSRCGLNADRMSALPATIARLVSSGYDNVG